MAPATTGITDASAGPGLALQSERSSERVDHWHERFGQWLTAAPPINSSYWIGLGSNAIILDNSAGGGPVLGFSVQRGNVLPAPPMPSPLVGRPTAEENVAWVRDSAGRIHAFASLAPTHSWYQYPLGTEFAVLSDDLSVPAKQMLRGRPGERAAILLSVAPLHPVLSIPCWDDLAVSLAAPHVVLPAGVIGPNGLLQPPFSLGLSGPYRCVELWTQGVISGPTCSQFLGSVAEPLRYY